jgi:ATP-dependent DNA ligase
VFDYVCRMGLEGIVSKRVDAPYRSGPSKAWVKVKNPASEAVRREREEDWSRHSSNRSRLPRFNASSRYASSS